MIRIGIIQGTSKKQKNSLLCQCVEEVMPSGSELINFGIYENSDKHLSYVQVALCVSLLLESKAVDFVVTGCSSGQGMMLACNALPGVMCGYIENVSDAYLSGRINRGNAVSYPLELLSKGTFLRRGKSGENALVSILRSFGG